MLFLPQPNTFYKTILYIVELKFYPSALIIGSSRSTLVLVVIAEILIIYGILEDPLLVGLRNRCLIKLRVIVFTSVAIPYLLFIQKIIS